MERLTWIEYGLSIAQTVSLRSADPYRKVGACILRKDHSLASTGYNGPPPGIEIDWTDRDERRKRVLHAEANALRYIQPGEGEQIFTTLRPCSECIKNIAIYGIKEIYYLEEYDQDPFALELAEEFNIHLERRKLPL